MSKLQAVIFDLDGVLTETSRQHFQAWQELARCLGFYLPEQVNERLKGVSRLESLEIVLKAGGLNGQFSELEKKQLAAQKNALYQSLIAKFTRENLSEGAAELLASLKEKGMKLGLASISKNALFLLEALKIRSCFDAVADPEQVLQGKPAPDIFLLAAHQLNVTPQQCIGIEDAYAGIEAIKRAGMKPLGIGNPEELSNCENVFQSLRQVHQALLEGLLK